MRTSIVLTLAATAVVGAGAGTVVARTALPDPAPVASGAPTTASPTGTGSSSGSGTPAATGQPLWATRTELHDGDTTVRIKLLDRPAAVERAAVGWVVTTATSDQEPAFAVQWVQPDGSTTFVADVFEHGDLTTDGTRYVGMRTDGATYGVWDLASGEQVDSIGRSRPGHEPAGGASVGPDGAVYTAWSGRDGTTKSIERTDLDSGASTEVATDFSGEWALSPDGRLVAGISASATAPGTGYQNCARVAPVADGDGSGTGQKVVTDCDVSFSTPSFSPDGDRVAGVSAEGDGPGIGLARILSTRPGEQPRYVDVSLPGLVVDARFLDEDHLLVLGSRDDYFESSRILVCPVPSGACTVVGQTSAATGDVALGTST